MESNLKKVINFFYAGLFLTLVFLPTVSWAVVGVPGTVMSAGGQKFEIDGNLICGNATASATGDDWAPPSTSANSTTPPATVNPCPAGTEPIFVGTGANESNAGELAATRFQDLVNSNADNSFSLGSKQEDTNTWTYTNKKVPSKSDIGNVYAVGRLNLIGDSMTAMVGFERNATSGSAHMDYELNQLPFVTNAYGASVPNRCSGVGDPDPLCSTADIILAVDDRTSTLPDLRVFKWQGNLLPSGKRSGSTGIFVEVPFIPSAVVYAATNSGVAVPAGPWGTFVSGTKTFNTAAPPTRFRPILLARSGSTCVT